ncbi:MAG: hypothetical protein ACYTF8_05540 [Planctomycetota bacterium]
MISTKGYSSSGRSWQPSCVAGTNFALPSGVGNPSPNMTTVPSEWSGSGHG